MLVDVVMNHSQSSQAEARPKIRERLGEDESSCHHVSCSTGLLARRMANDVRGVVSLTSCDLHAEALTSGAVVAVASVGTTTEFSFGTTGVSVLMTTVSALTTTG